MEAKDTVMTTEDVLAKLRELSDDKWLEVLSYMHTYERTLQAEISFKAGVEHGLVIAKKNYLLGKGHGIREVVEWIRLHPNVPFYRGEEWQAQKKEWGIDDE